MCACVLIPTQAVAHQAMREPTESRAGILVGVFPEGVTSRRLVFLHIDAKGSSCGPHYGHPWALHFSV